ncbi:HipA family kinase [Niallia oryzisoli]|uniref:HipA family kinase n=1 Tax=Niallia oryzisoli TaxID=1737571 RepID=UPI003736E1A9
MEEINSINLGLSKYPVQFIETLPGGTAHVILFSDGNNYVVKWNGTESRRAKEVINEYVVSKLGMLLSLPVVPFQPVYISSEFINKTPELQSTRYSFNPGLQSACLFIGGSITLKEVYTSLTAKTEIQNHDMLGAMVVFDHWVFNYDRTLRNVLMEQHSDGSYYFHMIDHGKCFPGGYTWTPQTIIEKRNKKLSYRETYQWIISILNGEDFTSFIEKIAAIPHELIYEVIQSIPEEWQVSTEERAALVTFLIEQKSNLPTLMESFINRYSGNKSTKKKKKKTSKN